MRAWVIFRATEHAHHPNTPRPDVRHLQQLIDVLQRIRSVRGQTSAEVRFQEAAVTQLSSIRARGPGGCLQKKSNSGCRMRRLDKHGCTSASARLWPQSQDASNRPRLRFSRKLNVLPQTSRSVGVGVGVGVGFCRQCFVCSRHSRFLSPSMTLCICGTFQEDSETTVLINSPEVLVQAGSFSQPATVAPSSACGHASQRHKSPLLEPRSARICS